MMIIKNEFHNTEYRTRKTRVEVNKILDTMPQNRAEKDKKWVYRVWDKLCGIKNCTCGNEIGERN